MGDVTYATIGSVKKLGKAFKELGVRMLLIDECHLGTNAGEGMFKTFKSDLDPRFLLGYTATPFRLSQHTDHMGYKYSQLDMLNRTRPKLFSDLISVTQIQELTAGNFWAPIIQEEYEFNTQGLLFNSSGAEYTPESIEAVNKVNNINNKIYLRTEVLMKEKSSILIFMDSVDNCWIMKKALGDKCAVVTGKTPKKERIEILNKFKTGEIQVVCCFMTLVVGFDFPALECVIMGRPTNSLAVFYQIYGRLVRPFEGKTGLFVDFGGNLKKFGKLEDLTIENYPHDGWGVYNQNKLITGVSMSGPSITKEMLEIASKRELSGAKVDLDMVMPFGKHKGTKVNDLSTSYIRWLFDNEIPLTPDLKATFLQKIKPTN